MKPIPFPWKRSGVIFGLLTLALLAGCPPNPTPNDGRTGPVGVVEMDQNTDPRFILRNQQGGIGRLKIAGNDVRLDGKRMLRDTPIQNGAHVATGSNSAAIVQFSVPPGSDCGLEIRDFMHGRLYGQAEKCNHMVATNAGVMETRLGASSYHVETMNNGVTIFTAIKGQALVWRHANPSSVVPVPGYHQVVLSRDGISPVRMVTPEEVVAITGWRKNFWRLREARIQPAPTTSDLSPGGAILLELLKGIFENSRPRGRDGSSDTESRPDRKPQSPDGSTGDGPPSAEPQSPSEGTQVRPGKLTPIKPSVLDRRPIRQVPTEDSGQLR